MITLAHTLAVLCLIILPLITNNKRTAESKPMVYENNPDTIGARYAINNSGYLEEISNDKVQDRD